MNDRKIKRLLNKEADKLLREKKYDLLQQKNPAKQKPGSKIKELMPALSAALAVLFIAAFAVVCYIPVALKNNEIIPASTEDGSLSPDMTGRETSDKEHLQSEQVTDNFETDEKTTDPGCDLQSVCDIINESRDFNEMAEKFEKTGVKIVRQYMATVPGTAGEEDRLSFGIDSNYGGYQFQRLYMRMVNKDMYITAGSEINSFQYCLKLTEPELEPFFCRDEIMTPEYVADNLISIAALSCSSGDEELVNERQKQYKEFVFEAIKRYISYIMGEAPLNSLDDCFDICRFTFSRMKSALFDSYRTENMNVSGLHYNDYNGNIVYCRVTFDIIIRSGQKEVAYKSDFNVSMRRIDGNHKIYNLTSNLPDGSDQPFASEAKAFKELLQRERAGEKPSEEEIEEIKNYIDNSYCGIDLEYERASYDDRLKAAANGEFSYEYAITHVKESGKEYGWSRVLVWDDLKNLGLKDYYEYPRLTLQTVCDIINESDDFDEIIYKLAEVDKFFSAAGCTASGESVYRYDIKLTGEKCYEFI